ncbi:MAG: DNA translocase FtsK 4TM domain-containing protein [Bacteroidales bacterium]
MAIKPQRNMHKKYLRTWHYILRIIIGIFLFIALYSTISILSFFQHWQEDYSLINRTVFAPESEVLANNWGGKLGSKIAQLVVTQGFGVSGILLPIALALLALYLYNVRRTKLLRLSVLLCVSTILISLSLGMLYPSSLVYGAGWGGAHGRYISQDWLFAIFGRFGSITLMCIAYALFIYGIIPTRFQRMIEYVQGRLQQIIKFEFNKNKH